MSDLALTDKPDHAPLTQTVNGKTKRVQGKLVLALKAIIWEGQELDEAAATAGLTTHTLRCALQRPHVIQYMKAERQVLLAYVGAQNIHYARKLRRSDNAMAALGAVKVIEGMTSESQARSSAYVQAPGLLIQIINPPAPGPIDTRLTQQQPQIIENDDGSGT